MAADELARLLDIWPSREGFVGEIPGNFTQSVNAAPSDAVMWRDHLSVTVRDLTRTTLSVFAPWLLGRFGDELKNVTTHVLLMEADPDFSGHPIHNHHWHSPNWIATALVYLDSVAEGYAGTVINKFRHADDPEACAQVFARTHLWTDDPDFSIHRVIGYAQNRLFGFLDGPMSYHSTLPADAGAKGHRRVLRMHISVPWELCEAQYGVSEDEYQSLHPRKIPTADPRCLAWARTDLTSLSRPVPINADVARNWAAGLEVEVPLTLDHG